jgi:hypothetical protein
MFNHGFGIAFALHYTRYLKTPDIMKTRLGLQVTMVLFLLAAVTTAEAQHRGRDRDHDNGRDRGRGHNNGNGNGRGDSKHYNDRDHHHHNDHKKVVHVYHHRPAPVERRVVVHHHHHTRPRYVYYSDYDVYYDCDREVFISFSGRNWTVSVARPMRMHHVDIYRASRVDVDYYNDDFPQYLEQRRPHGRVYAEW